MGGTNGYTTVGYCGILGGFAWIRVILGVLQGKGGYCGLLWVLWHMQVMGGGVY